MANVLEVGDISALMEKITDEIIDWYKTMDAKGVLVGLPGLHNPNDRIQVSIQVAADGGINAITRTQSQTQEGSTVTEEVQDGYEVVSTQDPVTTTEYRNPVTETTARDGETVTDSDNQQTEQNQQSSTGGGNVVNTTRTYE